MLTDGRIDNKGTLWLNSGTGGAVSCIISPKDISDVYTRYRVNDEEDFAGSYLLIIGTKETSKNEKKYIRIDDINHLVIQL